ncbi:2'-5' RNA ligase family protein [Gordonia sp. HY002]|uniref:2'-5' RNA ligase family protein n=2 Tax=Gordonia zhenghanii TaxID=2911516 RepID=UPI001F22BD1A|nr:2'-5' RNA ligase family protein [Gordonia zhenghanii]MCF8570692.1 2'-5' RNA ligase family protein [Gordonia zhenghanii]
MAQSIELLIDEEAQARVRDVWGALDAIGLRTPASVHWSTARPHCTLLAGSAIDESGAAHSGMAAVAQRLPFSVLLGAPVVFSSRSTFTIAASVVPSADLVSVHAAAYRLCSDAVIDLGSHCAPGSWTPHVTMARRVPASAIAEAVACVGEPITARVSAIRLWNGETKTETVVTGRAC